MKKLIISTMALLLMINHAAEAKEPTETQSVNAINGPTFQRLVLGARYMPTLSSIKVQNDNNTIQGDFILGKGYSGILGFNFTNHLGIQAEVIYSKLSQTHQDNGMERRIDLEYIHVPLLISLNTNRAASINLNVVVGPQIGMNAGATLTTTGSENGSSNLKGVLVVKNNDLGLAYGAGLDFGLNPRKTLRFDLGFRGVLGLTDISDQSGSLENDEFYVLQKSGINTFAGYFGISLLF
jgi:opacity protein-like surface antigen